MGLFSAYFQSAFLVVLSKQSIGPDLADASDFGDHPFTERSIEFLIGVDPTRSEAWDPILSLTLLKQPDRDGRLRDVEVLKRSWQSHSCNFPIEFSRLELIEGCPASPPDPQ